MREEFRRTQLLLGENSIERLEKANVLLFGVGGVGGFVAEALARSGVGNITLVDDDSVAISNVNRQIVALHSTIGKKKVDVMKERILDINPSCHVTAKACFYLPENGDEFDFTQYDYIVDAIDTVTAKIDIAKRADEIKVPFISSMGAGNKLDPTLFEVSDIYKTSVCPLAKVMRKELKKRGVSSCKVVYSKEKALTPLPDKSTTETTTHKKRVTPGSIAFVPSVVGLIIAGEVIKDLWKV